MERPALPPAGEVEPAPSLRSPTGSPFPPDAGRMIAEPSPPIEEEAPAEILAQRPLPAAPAPAPAAPAPAAAVKPPAKAVPEKPAAEKPAADRPAAARPAEKAAAPPAKAAAEKPVAEKAAARPAAPAAAAGSGRVYVQLLAARSETDVRGAWKALQSRNSDLLGGMSGKVAKADLGDRGVFYRLRAGPIASEAQARSLCSALASRNVSCLIVRQSG
jgi:cell division septation protein DedD